MMRRRSPCATPSSMIAALTVGRYSVASVLTTLYLPTVNAAIIDDGVAQGDLRRIMELGGVMLAVTAVQVVCA
ncbi:hypothetical protein C6A85_16880, partial [Mycobacterium sp. ITM-2017-0098]